MQIDKIVENLNGAIFDMDGLLVNSEELYAEANVQAAKDANLDVPDNFYETLSGSSLLDVEHFFNEYFPDTAKRNAFIKETDDLVWRWANEGRLKLQPGVKDTLELFAKNNIKMAVASSNYQNFVERFLSLTGISNYFEFYLYYGAVDKPKPAPDSYILAQKRLNVPKDQILIFEDSTTGVQAAKNAGIAVVMVPFITKPTPVDEANATLIVPSFNQFLELVK